MNKLKILVLAFPFTSTFTIKSLNCDIDLFVHELAKLFGHLGSPEYCHGGSTFRTFLIHKAHVSTGDEKEYYESAHLGFHLGEIE